MIYRYDGTFPGFLTAVYAVYHDGTSRMEDIRPRGEEASLFSEEKPVDTDIAKGEQVLAAFAKDCGGRAAHWLYNAFLGEQPRRERLLFQYMKEGFRRKKGLYQCRKEPWMWTICEWAHRTGCESHRMLGLLRFRELSGGLFYAEISPDCHVTPLIAGHFARRMSNVSWAIHDAKRHVAACYDRKKVILTEVIEPELQLSYSAEEEQFAHLWREYYRHIGIENRYNPDLRRSFMPEKYWAHLTEMEPTRKRTERPLGKDLIPL